MLSFVGDSSSLHAAFTAGTMISRPRIHRDQLPDPPRAWKDLDSHLYGDQFRAAAATEFRELEKKVTFCLIPQSVPLSAKAQILPLLWVFTYKFDTDRYLFKFKARICVRGDLQRPDNQATYAATLAARTFRALMAVTAAFDLETRHLDAVNAFLNSS